METCRRSRIREVLKRSALLGLPRNGGKKVVLEIRSDTRKILDDRNADLLELALSTNARSEEQLRCPERSLRDDGVFFHADDPAGSTLSLSHLYRNAAARAGGRRVKVETGDLSAGEDGQVLARVDALREVGRVGRRTLAVVDDGLEARNLMQRLSQRVGSERDKLGVHQLS